MERESASRSSRQLDPRLEGVPVSFGTPNHERKAFTDYRVLARLAGESLDLLRHHDEQPLRNLVGYA